MYEVSGNDLMIFVESLEDANGNRLSVGMALSKYSNTYSADVKLNTLLTFGTSSNEFLVIRHINKTTDSNNDTYYELWLGGYSKPMIQLVEHALVNTASSVPKVGEDYKFVQVGMNGYSPNSEFNINTLAPAEGTYGKIGAVGYTLHFLEVVEPEEITSTS